MPNVKLLLNDNIDKLGKIGEVVDVKPGYARNYLLPQGLASIPTMGEVRRIKKRKEELEKKYQEEKAEASKVAEKIEGLGNLVFKASAGESGKLFGSITSKDIATRISEEIGVEVNRKQLFLNKSITQVGEVTTKLRLHPEVIVDINVVVEADKVEKEKSEELVQEEEAAKAAEEEKKKKQEEAAAKAAEEEKE